MALQGPPLPEPRVQLPRAVREFLRTEAAGGVAILAAALVALAWANSPFADSYEELWHTELVFELGRFSIAEDLRHWVNDALMTLFFFVAGLEIKRELVTGHLRSWRHASLPVLGAVGGMVVPAVLFLAFNAGHPGVDGWGIPMATDIAFAVGVVALLSKHVSAPLKVFLLSLAIADDIGAIVVIALFYSSGIDWQALGVAVLLFAVVGVLRLARFNRLPPYVFVGAAAWLAVFESGIHATIAGVVIGLLTPATPMSRSDVVRTWARDLSEDPTSEEAAAMARIAFGTVSPAERVSHALLPWTTFVIVPIFALANAGVRFEAGALDAPGAARVTLGILVGLVVGKLVGITAVSWIAVRVGISELPPGADWRQLSGVAGVAGIGFTVALFVTDLAFDEPGLQAAAKIGILAASALAAVVGTALVLLSGPAAAPPAATIEGSVAQDRAHSV